MAVAAFCYGYCVTGWSLEMFRDAVVALTLDQPFNQMKVYWILRNLLAGGRE